MSDPDYYLSKDENAVVFENLLGRMMFSSQISSDNKMKLFEKYADYYREGDEEGINLPETIKISAFFNSEMR